MDSYGTASAQKSTLRRSGPPQGGRPPEIEESLNARLIHPASRRLAAALASTPATPNAVSVAGALAIMAAGAAYTTLAWPIGVAAGFGLHVLWHILDGADGALARRTGRASAVGEVVDGLCDHVGHIFLYVVLAADLAQTLDGWAWALASAAGASRIVQANHYETARRTYVWRVHGAPLLSRSLGRRQGPAPPPGAAGRVIADLARAYFALSGLVNPGAGLVGSRLEAAKGGGDEGRARELCRQVLALQVKRASWLSSNYRTLALGLSMAGGGPLYYFLLECTALNLMLGWSILEQGRSNRRLAARLATLGRQTVP